MVIVLPSAKKKKLLKDMDVFDREFFEGIEYEKEINPTVVAQDELFEKKVKSKYESQTATSEDTMP